MIIQCAWCQRMMGEKEPLEDTSVTHAMCPICFEKAMKELKELKRLKDLKDKGEK